MELVCGVGWFFLSLIMTMSTHNKKLNSKFSSRLGFIAAASGSAIGLGNIWKFPYEVGANGGAWFLLPYILFVIFLGYPLMLTKSIFGRKMKKGVYESYKGSGIWENIGILSTIICISVLSFYNVVTGWILGYIIQILKGNVLVQKNIGGFFQSFIKDIPSNLLYNSIVTLLVIIIINVGIQKGIEKCSKILMPIFIILLVGLIIYSFTLPNALKGVKFYLFPNNASFSIKTFSSALSQCFMSLALGTGVMITYGAYANKNTNLIEDSAVVVFSDSIVAFLAGLLIFPLIFYSGLKPNEGPSLIFIALPSIFKAMGPSKGLIAALMTFFLLFFAAITSAISQLEVPTKYIIERWKISRTKGVVIVGIVSYILGIPSLLSHGGLNLFSNFLTIKSLNLSFMDLLIKVIVDTAMPITALLFCIFISQRWKKYEISKEIIEGKSNNLGYKNKLFISKYVYISVKYIAPVLIGIVLISSIVN